MILSVCRIYERLKKSSNIFMLIKIHLNGNLSLKACIQLRLQRTYSNWFLREFQDNLREFQLVLKRISKIKLSPVRRTAKLFLGNFVGQKFFFECTADLIDSFVFILTVPQQLTKLRKWGGTLHWGVLIFLFSRKIRYHN